MMRSLLVLGSLVAFAASIPVDSSGSNATASSAIRAARQTTCVAMYNQCGGRGYTGPTNCDAESTCVRRSRWWSSCAPQDINIWGSCANDAGCDGQMTCEGAPYGACQPSGLCVVENPDLEDLVRFAKVNTESTKTNQAAGAPLFSYPITSSAIDGLVPQCDAVSMRAFGTGQLAGTTWTEVEGWIVPIASPTHAGSTDADVAAMFWDEFEQVVQMQAVRRNYGTMASDYVARLPTMFRRHTVAEAAAEVEKDFPTKFPTMLVEQFLDESVLFNADIVPHAGDDFVNKIVMLADVVGWAVSIVSPYAFAAKWQNGRARPEEVAWAVHSGDARVASAPAAVVSGIQALGLTDSYSFTAYGKGSPKHPSWPAMHSAASSASLYLAVLLDLTDTQLAEAQGLDCAVASFRTLAGVHYESDNMAGLSIGQEVIRRELPGYLQARYGSDPDVVTDRINSVIDAHDWRTAQSCFK